MATQTAAKAKKQAPKITIPGSKVKKKKATKKAPAKKDQGASLVLSPDMIKEMTVAEMNQFVEDEQVFPPEAWDYLDAKSKREKLAGFFGIALFDEGDDEYESIQDVVAVIESLSSEEDALGFLTSLTESRELSMFQMGGVLLRMKTNGWYGHGASDFYSFVRDNFGIEKRVAQHRMKVYSDLTALDIPVDAIKGIGWSKLRAASSILTEDNLTEVLSAIGDLPTKAAVEEFVADYAGKTKTESEESDSPSMMFKVSIHKDQEATIRAAIEKAKSESKTQFDGQALEYVCLDFLNSGAKPTPTLVELLKQEKASIGDADAALKAAVSALSEVYPEVSWEED